MSRPAPTPVSFKLGDITVLRLKETLGRAFKPAELLADFDPEAIDQHAAWLMPNHYDAAAQRFVMGTHSWILCTARHKILVDTCIGNHKPRPHRPGFNMLELPYLKRLAELGLKPEDITHVFCTHMHVDHVGWNTRLLDGRWVPTFPKAKYLFARAEYDWLKGLAEAAGEDHADDGPLFRDSVEPIVAAGLVEWVADGFQIEEGIRLEVAGGHTPCSMVMHVESGEGRALLIGDICHHPLQVYHPDWNSNFCVDPVKARLSRRHVLEVVAENGGLLMPAHFGAPHAVKVRRKGDAFEIPF